MEVEEGLVSVRAEDVFSAEYLSREQQPSQLAFLFDPRNQFNAGQALNAASTFSQVIQGQGTLAAYGLRAVRASRSKEWLVVRIEDPARSLRLPVEMPSLDLVPIMRFQPLWAQSMVLDVKGTLDVLRSGARRIDMEVLDPDGRGVADAKVVVVFDIARRLGAEVRTNGAGVARLAVPTSWHRAQSLAVIPRHSLWSHAEVDWPLPAQRVSVRLRSIAQIGRHPIRHHVEAGTPADGQGVVVGVIDSGVGPHADLDVAGGANLVENEDPAAVDLWTDNGLGHGTHVAGIIAGQGRVDAAYVGIAPGVTLRSYRVFAQGANECIDLAVSEAIEQAVLEGCDLINLSLGYQFESRAMTMALRRAAARGVVAVAAVGNDARQPVRYPAATPGVVAVSAIGRADALPKASVSSVARSSTVGTDPHDFLAAFTNVGHEVRATAPGVGIISCHPGGLYAVEDGTSMAAPVVTGLAARLLGRRPDILGMTRDQMRADAMRTLVYSAAQTLGFEPECVGSGLPTS